LGRGDRKGGQAVVKERPGVREEEKGKKETTEGCGKKV